MEPNIGGRLISARKMAGLSLQDLSDKLGNKISKQALNKYEKGLVKPNSKILIEISNILDVPIGYFFRKSEVEIKDIEFRKKSKLSKKEMEKIKQGVKDFLERYFQLEKLMNFKISFRKPIKNTKIEEISDVNKIANNLRKNWKLGYDPLPDLIELLEDKKIKIIEIEKSDAFDGMSAWVNNIPVIVINKSLNNIVRKRLTVLHELAHLLLEIPDIYPKKEKEKICFNFAGAFLIPEDSFFNALGGKRGKITLNELIIIEDYWGMSAQAVMARARFLDIISDYTYKNFNIWLNKSGNRKKELGNYHGREKPVRFYKLLYRAVSEGIISISKAASLAGKKLSEFRKEFEPVV
jgi:Zn-dependent peptidase ImmA (M78 family)